MRLKWIHVQNYRSLQDVWVNPADLSLLVGANASGKSNLADCLAFLADVYRDGLEIAVQRAGGYESIAFRRIRRTKLPITIDLEVELDDVTMPVYAPREGPPVSLLVRHRFAIKAQTERITADYDVTEESITVESSNGDGKWRALLEINRIEGRPAIEYLDQDFEKNLVAARHSHGPSEDRALYRMFFGLFDTGYLDQPEFLVANTDLLMSWLGTLTFAFRAFTRAMSAMRVHQINISSARSDAAPSPNAELERYGRNLPAAIDFLRKRHSDAWHSIIGLMQRVLPNLSNIETRNTQDRTLGLVFFEEGFRRPWGIKEVSDGTVQMLAMLVAIFDPRATLEVIEEPENSVHPWLIRVVLDACREASKTKQILLTSHSPIVVDAFAPDATFVIWRSGGASYIKPLRELDQFIEGKWQSGKIRLFNYLDSGIVPQAVPPAPEILLFDDGK